MDAVSHEAFAQVQTLVPIRVVVRLFEPRLVHHCEDVLILLEHLLRVEGATATLDVLSVPAGELSPLCIKRICKPTQR